MFEVGQRVYLKSVDELVALYGKTRNSIPVPHVHILPSMEKFCGNEYVIASLLESGNIRLHNTDGYIWPAAAFEPISDDQDLDLSAWHSLFTAHG